MATDNANTNKGGGGGGGGSLGWPQIHTPFLLRAQEWINELVEYEATHPHPAPLTKAQMKVLAELERTLPAPSGPEPDIGDTDWISILHLYRAANEVPGDDPPGPEFTELSGVVPGRSLAPTALPFRCSVRIGEHPEPFPNAACGLGPDGRAPAFAKKKDAKKYAAKCAVQWLRANKYMPETGVKFARSAVTPRSAAPAPAPAPARQQQTSGAAFSAPSPSRPLSTPRPPATPNAAAAQRANLEHGNGNSVYGTDEPSATSLVDELCKALHIRSPLYQLTQDPDHKDIFSGFPVFEMVDLGPNKLPPLPDGTGHVSGVFTRRLAKQVIAEALVPHLERAVLAKKEKVRKYMEEQRTLKATPERQIGSPRGKKRGGGGFSDDDDDDAVTVKDDASSSSAAGVSV